MSPPPKRSFFQHLSFLHDDTSSLSTQIAMISFKFPINRLLEALIVFFEYVQILSPLLLFSLCFQSQHENESTEIMIYLVRIVDPSRWLLFNDLNSVEIILLILGTTSIFFKYLLFGYIVL